MIQMIRQATVPAGLVFIGAGRPLRVVRVAGTDATAPVIVEELVPAGDALAGQYSLWALGAVQAAMVVVR